MQAAEVVSSTIHSFMTHLSNPYLRSRQCAECWSCHGDQDRTFSCFHSWWLWNESYKKRHLQYNLIKIPRPYQGSWEYIKGARLLRVWRTKTEYLEEGTLKTWRMTGRDKAGEEAGVVREWEERDSLRERRGLQAEEAYDPQWVQKSRSRALSRGESRHDPGDRQECRKTTASLLDPLRVLTS